MNRESNSYTFIFSTIMVVLIATALAFTSMVLKPSQEANIKMEKMQYILNSIGVEVSRDESEAAYKNYIKDEFVFDNTGKEIGKDAFSVNLARDKGKHPVFIAVKDNNTYYIIPVRGMGLWDAIWGYVSLDNNLRVNGVVFDHKAETPGLGSEITEKYFEDRFIGEQIFTQNGTFQGLKVVKSYSGGDNKTDGEVDGISGSTLTCNGVSHMLFDGLEPYINYLQSIKK